MFKIIVLSATLLVGASTYAIAGTDQVSHTVKLEAAQQRVIRCLNQIENVQIHTSDAERYVPRNTATRIARSRKVTANGSDSLAFKVTLRPVDHRTTVMIWQSDNSANDLEILRDVVVCAGASPSVLIQPETIHPVS